MNIHAFLWTIVTVVIASKSYPTMFASDILNWNE